MSSSLFGNSPQANPMENIAALYKLYQSSANPMVMLKQMALNDPRFETINQQLTANGQNGSQAFYSEAKKRGMSDEEISTFITNLRMTLGG